MSEGAVIATRDSLTAQLEIAQDQGAPPERLSALRTFQVVSFFSDSGGAYMNMIGDNWLQYCLPPQICRGRQDYYWALFDFPSNSLPSPVYPYEAFLRNHTAAPR
jgi:hypothetical protein